MCIRDRSWRRVGKSWGSLGTGGGRELGRSGWSQESAWTQSPQNIEASISGMRDKEVAGWCPGFTWCFRVGGVAIHSDGQEGSRQTGPRGSSRRRGDTGADTSAHPSSAERPLSPAAAAREHPAPDLLSFLYSGDQRPLDLVRPSIYFLPPSPTSASESTPCPESLFALVLEIELARW